MKPWRSSRVRSWFSPKNEWLGLTDSANRKVVLTAIWARRLLVVSGLYYAASTFGLKPHNSPWWDTIFYDLVSLFAGIVGITKAKLASGRSRRIWIVWAIALNLNSAGLCVGIYNRLTYGLDNLPTVSLADAAYIAFYPLAYVVITMLAREQIRQIPRSIWLDGVIGASAVSAAALAYEFQGIADGAKGLSTLQWAIAYAYPMADVLIIALIIGLMPLLAWRPSRVWLYIALAAISTSVGDFYFQNIADSYKPGTPWDIPWALGFLFYGLAPWQKSRVVQERGYESWGILAMPIFFALVSLGVLVIGTTRDIPTIAIVFAVVGVFSGLLRLGLTFGEIRGLAESRQQARTDELTELNNRRYFYEKSNSLLRGRKDSDELALLVIDLDRFKEINDSLGHQIGDDLLRQLGPRLLAIFSKESTVARLGGDEFAVVMDGAGAPEAMIAAEHILSALDEPFILDGVPVRISASVGIALFPEHAKDTNGLLQHADVAMYTAKREHTGPQVYLPQRDALTKERLRSIHELRRSIEQNRLVVHYQPQIGANKGDVVGCEALVRMTHPTRGIIPPDAFLPLAEQAGLMRNLTSQVLRMVLDDMVQWRSAGRSDLKVSINLSVTNLLDVAFPEEVQREISARQIDPARLVFEVTEGTMLSDIDRALAAAAALRALGSEVSLDDYGTGYASLAYLRKFPLDELKLDRSFVAELDSDAVARTFVRSAIEVAHALGIRVVAEGIETQAIWNAVRACGGDICQGYYFSRPVPSDEFFSRFIARNREQAPATDLV